MKRKFLDFFKKYRMGWDYFAILLFLCLLVPTFIWLGVRKAGDVLSAASLCPEVDIAGYVFLGVTAFVAAFVVRKDREKINFYSFPFLFFALSLALYFAAWIFYFCGYENWAVFLFLALFPCTAIASYAVLRKNWFALVPLAVFFSLHLSSAFINFI